jgi:hypothetical protein
VEKTKGSLENMAFSRASPMNRNSERIPRSLLKGLQSNVARISRITTFIETGKAIQLKSDFWNVSLQGNFTV